MLPIVPIFCKKKFKKNDTTTQQQMQQQQPTEKDMQKPGFTHYLLAIPGFFRKSPDNDN